MKRALMFATLSILTVASTAVAQSKPSFAGKWTLIPSSIAPEPNGNGVGGTGGFGHDFTIAQDDKSLTVLSTYPTGDKSKAVYALDGSETKNAMTARGTTVERVSRAKWDGVTLVISTTTSLLGRTIPTVQILSLDASGNLVIEARASLSGPPMSKASFKKEKLRAPYLLPRAMWPGNGNDTPIGPLGVSQRETRGR